MARNRRTESKADALARRRRQSVSKAEAIELSRREHRDYKGRAVATWAEDGKGWADQYGHRFLWAGWVDKTDNSDRLFESVETGQTFAGIITGQGKVWVDRTY